MDIKNLSAEEIREAQKRLASRKSFFGGSLSTRVEASAPTYSSGTEPVYKASSKAHAKPKSAAGQSRKPAVKRPRDTTDDFATLDDEYPPPSKPGSGSQTYKAGDVWGQYMAAQARKRNTQHASGATAKQARVTGQRPLHPNKAPSAKPSSHAKGMKPSRVHPAGGRQQAPRHDEEDGDDLADFIDDDLAGEDWRSELQAVTGYNPSKFEAVRDDRRMVASKVDIEREERQSKRIGRLEDEKAEEEERRLRALKETKREKHRSKSKGRNKLALLE